MFNEDAMATEKTAQGIRSFSADIVPILLTRCGGCHLKATGGSGGLSLGVQAELAYAALVDQDTILVNPVCGDMKRVDPGNADVVNALNGAGARGGLTVPAIRNQHGEERHQS